MSLVFDREQVSGELTRATAEVLETMFFASVEVECSAEEARRFAEEGRRSRLLAEISFHGASTGTFQISVEQDVAEGLASSFLGEQEPATGTECWSAMGELANMVCGNLLSRLGKKSIFHLDSPRVGLEECAEGISAVTTAESSIVKFMPVDSGLLRLAVVAAMK